ncbi:25555_t:CDS:2, partial [Gigaspora rosea]
MTDEIEKCIEEKNINKFNYSEFESHEKIGGGSGIVNKSVWKKELVVLKYIMIRNDTDLEENTIVNFIRELQILQRVSFHPNIVQFYVLEKLRDIKPPSENLPPPSNIPFHTDLPARFSKMITIEHALEIASEISNSPCNVDHISERFKLLFSSTGKLDKDVFFSKCKNQEKTVIILKVEETEEIIGGYNPLAWKKLFFGGARYFETNESFIFSLKTKNLDYSLFSRVEDSKYAIYSQSGCGPSFGLYDLGMSKHDKEGRTWMCRKGSYEMQIRPIPGSFKIKECETVSNRKKQLSWKMDCYVLRWFTSITANLSRRIDAVQYSD